MIVFIIVSMVYCTAVSVFLGYQTVALRKALDAVGWGWVIAGFVLILTLILWANLDAGIFLWQTEQTIPWPSSARAIRRTVRLLVLPPVLVTCFSLGFHKLHKSLEVTSMASLRDRELNSGQLPPEFWRREFRDAVRDGLEEFHKGT